MRKQLLILLTALLCYTFQTQAQVYEPGLLVRSNGDTLRGEIENGFWVEPPAFIHFRPAPGSPTQLFQPRQLQTVLFTGGRYFRYAVLPIDHAAETRFENLPHGNYPDIRQDSVLAEVLVEGPASLLRVARASTTHYLLLRPGRPTLDLSIRRYLRRVDNGAWVSTDGNNYHSQLDLFFGDCPAATQAAKSAKFTLEALAAVVQIYNQQCAAQRQAGRNWLAQAAAPRRVAFQGGFLAGVRYNRLASADLSGTPNGPCVDCQARPFAGLYAEVLQPSRTAALYAELSISQFRNQKITVASASSAAFYSTVDYRAWLGTARLGVRYFFPLAHGQQWLFTASYESNVVVSPSVITASAPIKGGEIDNLSFASPTLLPNLGVGWRTSRITLNLDGQLYRTDESYWGHFVSSDFTIRLSAAYRLGQNSDEVPAAPTRR